MLQTEAKQQTVETTKDRYSKVNEQPNQQPNEQLNKRHNIDQVRWSCRRGMLELDQILIPFCDEFFAGLASDKQANFIKLLEANDQDLYSWLLGTDLPDQPVLQDLAMVLRFLAKKRVPQVVCLE